MYNGECIINVRRFAARPKLSILHYQFYIKIHFAISEIDLATSRLNIGATRSAVS